MFTTAKGLPGSYTIAKLRNFPEEQKKKKLLGTISMETQYKENPEDFGSQIKVSIKIQF